MQNIDQTLGGGTVRQALRASFTEPMQNIDQTLGGGMTAGASAGSLASPALFEGAKEPSIEQRVAELAAKMGISPVEARGMILRGMVEKRGGTLSDDIINQFAQGLITLQEALAQVIGPVPKMQTGGIVPLDLFEEGDQDINQALNMMSGAVNPPGAVVEETETISIKEEPSPMEEASDFQ